MATGEGATQLKEGEEEKSFWQRLISPVSDEELQHDVEARDRRNNDMTSEEDNDRGHLEPGTRPKSWYSDTEDQIAENTQMTSENRRRLVRLDERTAAQMKIFLLFLGSLGLAALMYAASELAV